MKNNSYKKIFYTAIILFGLAMSTRLYYFAETKMVQPIMADSASYVFYANNLKLYHTFSKEKNVDNIKPDSFWSPGYPFFLYGCMKIADVTGLPEYTVSIFIQNLLGALVVMMTFLLALHFMSYSWSVIASLLCLFSPHLISYTSVLLTETLFSFFLVLSLYSISNYLNYKKKVQGISAGILFGMAYLTNQVFFFYPLLLVLIFVLVRKSLTLIQSSYFIIPFLLLVMSWNVRNSISVESDTNTSSQRLLMNLINGSDSDLHNQDDRNFGNSEIQANKDIIEFNGSYKAFFKSFYIRFKENPSHFLYWYFIQKPLNLWRWDIGIGYRDIYVYPVFTSPYMTNDLAKISHFVMKEINYWLFALAFLCALWGVVMIKTFKKEPFMIIVLLIYTTAVYTITQADSRYSVPFKPEMYLLAIYFIQLVVKKIKNKYFPNPDIESQKKC